MNILYLTAFLFNERMPEALFDIAINDRVRCQKALSLLGQFSVIRYDDDTKFYSMHGLVQQILRDSMTTAQRGSYRKAATFLIDALNLRSGYTQETDKTHNARIELLIGNGLCELGKLHEGRVHFEKSLRLLGIDVPPAVPKKLIKDLVTQLFVIQPMHRFGYRTKFRFRNTDDRARYLEAAKVYERLAQIYWYFNENEKSFYTVIKGLNLAEAAAENSPQLARSYASFAVALGSMGFKSLTNSYIIRAEEINKKTNDASSLAWTRQVVGVHRTQLGDWDVARKNLNEAVELWIRLENSRRFEECSAALAGIEYVLGRFDESVRLSKKIWKSACERNDPQCKAFALLGESHIQLRRGEFDKLLTTLNSTLKFFR